jgi:hypothetical protein
MAGKIMRYGSALAYFIQWRPMIVVSISERPMLNRAEFRCYFSFGVSQNRRKPENIDPKTSFYWPFALSTSLREIEFG